MYYLKYFIMALIFLALNSCSQTFQNNGLSENKVKKFNIEIGKTSKKNLIAKYGPPIFENVFNDNVIYYVSHNTSYKTFNKRETNKLLVYEIILDDKNIVQNFRKYSEKDRIDVDISNKQDDKKINLTSFWKDFIRALKRTDTVD